MQQMQDEGLMRARDKIGEERMDITEWICLQSGRLFYLEVDRFRFLKQILRIVIIKLLTILKNYYY